MSVFLQGDRIYLEPLSEKHLQPYSYIKWLNDPQINKFTSRGRVILTVKDGEDYIKNCQKPDRIVFAICDNKDSYIYEGGFCSQHFGNISLQQIDLCNRSAEIAILIGEKSAHGKGYGLEAARLLCAHGFNQLGLNRIYCGTHAENFGMQKLALKLGMREEGRSRKALFKNGEFADIINYGMLREDFKKE